MSIAAAKMRSRADPETLLKTAPFAAGPGASDGGVEMVEGGMFGVAAAIGGSEGEEVGGAGGEDDGGTAAGTGDGDNALLGGVATGVLVGDKAGEEAGD